MKNYIVVLLVILMSLSIVSCSNKTQVQKSTQSAQKSENKQDTQTAETFTEPSTKAIEAPTEMTTSESTEKPTQEIKEESWKKLYINQLNLLNKDEYTGFLLVYVDSDDVPELYVNGTSRVVEGHLYWVCNNQLCEYPISSNGFSYVEHGNLILNEGGLQGHCFEEILSIDEKTIKLKAKGDYVDPMLAGYESYIWDGVAMTQNEYETAKLTLFDKSTAITPVTYYSYSEICKQITEW